MHPLLSNHGAKCVFQTLKAYCLNQHCCHLILVRVIINCQFLELRPDHLLIDYLHVTIAANFGYFKTQTSLELRTWSSHHLLPQNTH